MEWAIVLILILVGLVLLIAEIIFIPGTTIAGIIGSLMSIVGIFLAFYFFGNSTGASVMSVAVFIASIAVYYGFSAKTWDKIALHDTQERAEESIEKSKKLLVGAFGTAKTDLRPVGTGIFDGEFFEVAVMRGYIRAGKPIKVIKISGNKIYVESLENEV